LEEFTERTKADELMVASAIYDHSARLRSYEMLAETFRLAEATEAPIAG